MRPIRQRQMDGWGQNLGELDFSVTTCAKTFLTTTPNHPSTATCYPHHLFSLSSLHLNGHLRLPWRVNRWTQSRSSSPSLHSISCGALGLASRPFRNPPHNFVFNNYLCFCTSRASFHAALISSHSHSSPTRFDSRHVVQRWCFLIWLEQQPAARHGLWGVWWQ